MAAAVAVLVVSDFVTNTRISIARSLGTEDYIESGDVRRLVELGGFFVQGPMAVDEALRRYGTGDYRVTAYALEAASVLWEVVCSIGAPRS